MKKIIKLSLVLFLFMLIQCSHNNRITPEQSFKNTFIGLGVRIKGYQSGFYISKVVKGGPVDKLPSQIKIKAGDTIIAAGRNKNDITPLEEKNFNERRKRITGKIGDKLFLKVSREYKKSKKKIWIVPIFIKKFTYTGDDLLEARLHHMRNIYNSELSNERMKKLPIKLFVRNARNYFQFYMNHRPSPIANDALKYAFNSWSNGMAYSEVEKVIKHIPVKNKIWNEIGHYIWGAYARAGYDQKDKKILKKGVKLVKSLIKKLPSITAKSNFTYELAYHYFDTVDYPMAKKYFKRVINYNTSPYEVRNSKGYLYEMEKLGIGNLAPLFKATSIKGNEVNLETYRGKHVALLFWSPWCGFCRYEYKYWRQLRKQFSKNKLVIIGICNVDDSSKIPIIIKKENLNWPHIIQGWSGKTGIDRKIKKLYNINGVPHLYIIGPKGKIVGKNYREEKLLEEVEKLLN